MCKTEDDLATENAQNESISLLLCEETIPGSPAPACPKEQCDVIKKSNYDSMFTSPMQVADTIDTKPVPTETSTTAADAKQKSKNATPRSSPRDSMSQEDSSEENNKKPGLCAIDMRCVEFYWNVLFMFMFHLQSPIALVHRKNAESRVSNPKLNRQQSVEKRRPDEIPTPVICPFKSIQTYLVHFTFYIYSICVFYFNLCRRI